MSADHLRYALNNLTDEMNDFDTELREKNLE